MRIEDIKWQDCEKALKHYGYAWFYIPLIIMFRQNTHEHLQIMRKRPQVDTNPLKIAE